MSQVLTACVLKYFDSFASAGRHSSCRICFRFVLLSFGMYRNSISSPQCFEVSVAASYLLLARVSGSVGLAARPRTVKFELPRMASSTPLLAMWYILPWRSWAWRTERISTFWRIHSAHSRATRFCCNRLARWRPVPSRMNAFFSVFSGSREAIKRSLGDQSGPGGPSGLRKRK
jgi:hypothetical protein